MYPKQEKILQYSREGKSQREISWELGINRLTVKKYLNSIEMQDRNLATQVHGNDEHEGNRNGQAQRAVIHKNPKLLAMNKLSQKA